MPKVNSRSTSEAQEDYLKALYDLDGCHRPVATSELADVLGVSPASVSEMVGKLAARELISHDHHRGAQLTAAGTAVALEMVRHHRIVETYLVDRLGYGWDEVHEEADRLEHAISERLEQRMWEALGHPAHDPHGDPIPAPDGSVRAHADRPLPQALVGSSLRVTRISDRDAEMLRAIERLGLRPGAHLKVTSASRWESPVELEVEGGSASVPLGLARAIHVEDRVG